MKNNLNTFFLIAILIIAGYATYRIFAPFLTAIFLAFVLSHLFKSWYQKISKKIGGRKSWASFITCVLVLLIFIIPASFVSLMVVSEIGQSYQKFKEVDLTIPAGNLSRNPLIEKFGMSRDISRLADPSWLSESFRSAGNFFFEIIKKTYQGTAHFIFMIFILFFALYYFFKDREKIEKKMMELSPLKNSKETALIKEFISVSRATLKGSLVLSILQGAVQGLVFWLVGVPSPAFWGLITAILCLIPMLGSAMVWFPAGIILLLTGRIWEGVVVLASGALVIAPLDNVLRPKLIGNDASLHPLIVFFSTLGGLAVFGLAGFILGPVIVALFLSLLDIYKSEFKKELQKFNA